MRCTRSDEIVGLDFSEHWINPANDLDFSMLKAMEDTAVRGAASHFLFEDAGLVEGVHPGIACLLYTSPSPRDS